MPEPHPPLLGLPTLADSKLNAHLPFITMLRDQGREKAEMWLESNFQTIGERSSVDLAELFS